MVFEILEKEGEIIKSVPSVEVLENEEFDQQFDVAYVTSIEQKEITDKIMKVSEIKQVSIQPIGNQKQTERTENIGIIKNQQNLIPQRRKPKKILDPNENKQQIKPSVLISIVWMH